MVFGYLAVWVASVVVSVLLAPKPKLSDAKADQLNPNDLPIAGQGTVIPVLFGTRWLRGANVVWFGDLGNQPIRKKVKTGLFSKKKQTVGISYSMGLHMVYAMSVLEVTEVRADGKTVVADMIIDNQDRAVNLPDLFGGPTREGGLVGTLRIRLGSQAQGPDPYLVSKLGADVPAMRGVLSLIWSGTVSANSPRPKPFEVRARNTIGPCTVISPDHENPAVIIRKVMTSRVYGLGLENFALDNNSFTTAEFALESENFGLCFLWSDGSTVEDFLRLVLRHIDAVLYMDPSTGLWVLKLIRPVSAALMLDRTNVIEVEQYTRPAMGELVNQVAVTWIDAPDDKPASLTVQDLASIEVQGSINATTIDYPGVATYDLAQRIALRDLRSLSNQLARVTLVCNREASLLRVGDVVDWNWPDYGIDGMQLRVVRIAYGSLEDGRVRVECVQDAFSLDTTVIGAPAQSQWQPPVFTPAPVQIQALLELPHWMVFKFVAGGSTSALSEVAPTDAYFAALGARPDPSNSSYQAWARTGADAFAFSDDGAFSHNAVVSVAIPRAQADHVIEVILSDGLDQVQLDAQELILVDDEIMRVTSINVADGFISVQRGMLDTVPAEHLSGARLWFLDPRADLTDLYQAGTQVDVKLRTVAGSSLLDESAAPTISRVASGRFDKPLPPGDLRLNAIADPVVVAGDVLVSWAHRDRTQQFDLVTQAAASIGPEAGTTYIVRVRDAQGTLVRTYASVPGSSQAWTVADALADIASAIDADRITIEVRSSRAGVDSLQMQSVSVDRAGYGLRWGQYWGGV